MKVINCNGGSLWVKERNAIQTIKGKCSQPQNSILGEGKCRTDTNCPVPLGPNGRRLCTVLWQHCRDYLKFIIMPPQGMHSNCCLRQLVPFGHSFEPWCKINLLRCPRRESNPGLKLIATIKGRVKEVTSFGTVAFLFKKSPPQACILIHYTTRAVKYHQCVKYFKSLNM